QVQHARPTHQSGRLVDAAIHAVVEAVRAQLLEVRGPLRRGKETLAELRVRIHRAAHVEQQEDAQIRSARRTQLDLQLAGAAGGGVDGARQVDLVGGDLAHDRAQAPQCLRALPCVYA